MNWTLETPPEIEALLAAGAPVAVGVSGGKDSVACALAVAEHLYAIGYKGPKLLVHADLGAVEWVDSGPACERLNRYLANRYISWPLHTVRRAAGGMMERWESRWASSRRRYENLECVKLILPWSTPSMRFCTSELKSAPIASFLKKMFPKQKVISVTGIRADESPNRAKMPAAKPNPRLNPGSLDWNPILKWPVQAVWDKMKQHGLPPHEAYGTFGSSRVSCAFCIMSKADDLRAALSDPRNMEIYRRMCILEQISGFAFQQGKWLSDLAPEPLASQWKHGLINAKEKAAKREVIEKRIPKELEFTKGWPLRMPALDEAGLIAKVRADISILQGITPRFTTPFMVLKRYKELMDLRELKELKNKRP
jgi:3'-phosphoadenosine 5'-phosphosulfate sulfotransferase (PAPS reductase)/FAD synthetase